VIVSLVQFAPKKPHKYRDIPSHSRRYFSAFKQPSRECRFSAKYRAQRAPSVTGFRMTTGFSPLLRAQASSIAC